VTRVGRARYPDAARATPLFCSAGYAPSAVESIHPAPSASPAPPNVSAQLPGASMYQFDGPRGATRLAWQQTHAEDSI
jgi:hypothetical protein